MKLDSILTRRYNNRNNFWQIVYEWEDEIAKCMGLSLKYDSNVLVKYALGRFPVVANALARSGLSFEMAGHQNHAGYNSRRVLPCIVDWYLRDDDELSVFYRQYKNNPAVLISSKEAYDFLKAKKCPLNIYHWPLSLSGRYLNQAMPMKKYDAVIMGRCSPTLLGWLEKYSGEHSEFTYVTRRKKSDHFVYCSSSGMEVGRADTREEYMNVMLQCKVGLYSTPSVDGLDLSRTKGFNQVTPRFLEYLACGCHVISRYDENSDTRFYDLGCMSVAVNDYDNFSSAMADLVLKPFDIVSTRQYLDRHSTADRVKRLREILGELK